jgi:hypothetical protein
MSAIRKTAKTAKIAYAFGIVALTGVKIAGDVRRHAEHENHSQHCDCFSTCYRCSFEAATARREKPVQDGR